MVCFRLLMDATDSAGPCLRNWLARGRRWAALGRLAKRNSVRMFQLEFRAVSFHFYNAGSRTSGTTAGMMDVQMASAFSIHLQWRNRDSEQWAISGVEHVIEIQMRQILGRSPGTK